MTRSSNVVKLSSSSNQRLSMFDFNQDDERVETTSKNLLGKFLKPYNNNKRKRQSSFSSSPIDKYTFLQSFTGCDSIEEKENRRNETIVVDDDGDGPIDVDAQMLNVAPCDAVTGGTEIFGKGISDELVDIDANSAEDCIVGEDSAVKEICTLNAPAELSDSSNYQNEQRDMISGDDGDKSEMSSSSTSICTPEENEVQSEITEPECCSLGHKIDILNEAVVVFPDFILYGDIYCTESRLTFSSSRVRVEGSAVNGSKGMFNAEWVIGDIASIESEWCGRVETAWINFHFKSSASNGVGNAKENSGINKLKFSVYDPYWSEAQEAIKLLDVQYRDIWNITLDIDGEKIDNDFTRFNSMDFSKPYLHVLDETFEDVIYPKGDPDAVSISKRDVELLWPETFINDTIIDFYIKFLKNKIQPEDQHRFHFFNSFFFRKLADLDKDPSSVREGRAAFERVRKWTKKVNLFEKDYIFIPVNYSLHWSLIIICHPGEVAHFRDEACESALKVPCILHMDSIRGSHKGLKNLIQSYLCEEWKARHGEILDDVSSKFSCLRFVSLELPQQENSFDCGLFLLHYVELFLEEVPINFNPFKITEFSNYLNRNWFVPQEASLKRAHIKKLIFEILEDQSEKVLQVGIAKYPCSQFCDRDEQEAGVELLDEECRLIKMCQGYSSCPVTELGSGISLPSVSSPRVVQQQIKEPGLDSRKEFEPGPSARIFSCGSYSQMEARGISYMSPIEEESVEQISDSSTDPDYRCQIATLATESPNLYIRKDFRSLDTSWEQNALHVGELYVDDSDDDSSTGTSSSESQKSSEIGVDENHLHHEFEGFDHPKEADRQESSISSGDLETCIVADSQEADCSRKENDPTLNDGECSSMDKIVRKGKIDNDNLMPESD